MSWQPSFALVLIYVVLITYYGALIVEKRRGEGQPVKKLLVWGVSLSLLPLVVFKYSDFINGNITALLQACGLSFKIPGLNWAIPIGISFYTFQALGYFVDVYKQKIQAEQHNFLDYSLFVCFFPQVLSGPISKGCELLPQLKSPRTFTYEKGFSGMKQLVWGLFLKLVLAERLGMCVNSIIYGYYTFSGFTCFIGSILYSLQIYCDFAGYSFIAIGVARLFGFNLINNFQQPYFAVSITDFWHRWHISLSRWLKDCVYIPMGGSRCSKLRNYWNIFVTFLVSGIWHGSNWNFILWGCMHGVAQIIEKVLGLQKAESKGFLKFARIVVTFAIVNFAWLFFRMPSIDQAFAYIGHMFTTPGGFDIDAVGLTALLVLGVSLPILFFYDIWQEYFPNRVKVLNKYSVVSVVLVFLLTLVISVGVLDSSTFIYANF